MNALIQKDITSVTDGDGNVCEVITLSIAGLLLYKRNLQTTEKPGRNNRIGFHQDARIYGKDPGEENCG